MIELWCTHRNEVAPLRFGVSWEIIDRDRIGRLARVRRCARKAEIDTINQPRKGASIAVGSLKIGLFKIVRQGHFLGDMIKRKTATHTHVIECRDLFCGDVAAYHEHACRNQHQAGDGNRHHDLSQRETLVGRPRTAFVTLPKLDQCFHGTLRTKLTFCSTGMLSKT